MARSRTLSCKRKYLQEDACVKVNGYLETSKDKTRITRGWVVGGEKSRFGVLIMQLEKIKHGFDNRDDDGTHQVALINFERESAAKTAVLLSNGKENSRDTTNDTRTHVGL